MYARYHAMENRAVRDPSRTLMGFPFSGLIWLAAGASNRALILSPRRAPFFGFHYRVGRILITARMGIVTIFSGDQADGARQILRANSRRTSLIVIWGFATAQFARPGCNVRRCCATQQ